MSWSKILVLEGLRLGITCTSYFLLNIGMKFEIETNFGTQKNSYQILEAQ